LETLLLKSEIRWNGIHPPHVQKRNENPIFLELGGSQIKRGRLTAGAKENLVREEERGG
jgi:hypothetical protein